MLEESSSFWDALLLSLAMFQRGGYLVQDIGMACCDRLALSGVYLCFFSRRISGEVMAVRGIKPACSTCYIPGYSSSCGQCFILPLRCRDCVSLKRLSGQWNTNTSSLGLRDLTKLNCLQWSSVGFQQLKNWPNRTWRASYCRWSNSPPTSIISSWRLFESGRMAKLTSFLLGSEVKNGLLS